MMDTRKKKKYEHRAIVSLLAALALAVSIVPNATKYFEVAHAAGAYKAVHRLYNPNSGDHHYTTEMSEKQFLENVGWNYEGIGWFAAATSESPVYRLYNPNATSFNHHYTMDKNERDFLLNVGWKNEGIGWYSCNESDSIPVYRVYNPNSGEHHYTKDKNEKQFLVSLGWNDEGVAWKAANRTTNSPEVPDDDDPQTEPNLPERERNLYLAKDSTNTYFDFHYSGDKVDWENAPTADDYNSGKAKIPDGVVRYYNEVKAKYGYRFPEGFPELKIGSVYYGVYKEEPFRIFDLVKVCTGVTEYGEIWDPNQVLEEMLEYKSRYTGETAGINSEIIGYEAANEQAKLKQYTRNGLSYSEVFHRLWARKWDPIWGDFNESGHKVVQNRYNRVADYSFPHAGLGVGCAAYAASMQEFAMDYGYEISLIDLSSYKGKEKLNQLNRVHLHPGDYIRYGDVTGFGHAEIVAMVLAEGDHLVYVYGDADGKIQGMGSIEDFGFFGDSLSMCNGFGDLIYSFWPDIEAKGERLPDPDTD